MTVTAKKRPREGEDITIRVTAYDQNGVCIDATQIESATYSVHDWASKRELRAAEAVNVNENPFDLVIEGSVNRIVDRRREKERHALTLTVQYTGAQGPGQVAREQVFFDVENLRFIS